MGKLAIVDIAPRVVAGKTQRKFVTPSGMSLDLPEDTSEDEWRAIGEGLHHVEGRIQWWLGDWWVFGESHYGDRKAMVERDDWNGPGFGACMNAASVCRAFETSRRREVLSFNHHVEVAALPAKQADDLLDIAVVGNGEEGKEWKPLSSRELRAAVKRVRQSSMPALALPVGKYGTIVIDPPWEMEKIEREVRPNQKGFDYATMDEDELVVFGGKVNAVAGDDCHLFIMRFFGVTLKGVEAAAHDWWNEQQEKRISRIKPESAPAERHGKTAGPLQ